MHLNLIAERGDERLGLGSFDDLDEIEAKYVAMVDADEWPDGAVPVALQGERGQDETTARFVRGEDGAWSPA